MECTLASIEPGNTVKVIQVRGRGPTRRRILDMGLVPGVMIQVVRRAPLGDPIEFEVKGYKLSMRKTEADLIIVSSEVSDA